MLKLIILTTMMIEIGAQQFQKSLQLNWSQIPYELDIVTSLSLSLKNEGLHSKSLARSRHQRAWKNKK